MGGFGGRVVISYRLPEMSILVHNKWGMGLYRNIYWHKYVICKCALNKNAATFGNGVLYSDLVILLCSYIARIRYSIFVVTEYL